MEAGFASHALIPTFHIHQPFQIRIFRNMSVSLSPWYPETHPALNHWQEQVAQVCSQPNGIWQHQGGWILCQGQLPAQGWCTSRLWWDMNIVQASWEIYSWPKQQCRINNFILKGSIPSEKLPKRGKFQAVLLLSLITFLVLEVKGSIFFKEKKILKIVLMSFSWAHIFPMSTYTSVILSFSLTPVKGQIKNWSLIHRLTRSLSHRETFAYLLKYSHFLLHPPTCHYTPEV